VVIGLGDPLLEIIHFEFQASASANKHADMLVYNVLLHRQYRAPVHTVVVLLRPEAAHANLTGAVAYSARPNRGKMDFRYEVIRLWDMPAEKLLASDLGLIPLATLGKLPGDGTLHGGLAIVIQRLIERLQSESPPDQARRLLTAAYVLTGLRIADKRAVLQLFKGVRAMRESVTYMAILDEGRVEEAIKIILRQGRKLFGPPDEATLATLTATDDLDRLELLSEQLLDARSWQELLAR